MMAIKYAPFYRYPLIDKWDKKLFVLIKEIGTTGIFPKFIGSLKDRNEFLKKLIRTQKSLHGWRSIFIDIFKQIKKDKIIDFRLINIKYPSNTISKNTPPWVTYKEDKIVSKFIDTLEFRDIDFIGNESDLVEFILRFMLGQLGNDWECTILMIWEILGNRSTIKIKDLNKELKTFDYLHIIAPPRHISPS